MQYQRESDKKGVEEVEPEDRAPAAGLSQEELDELKHRYTDQGMFDGMFLATFKSFIKGKKICLLKLSV